jgi:hypothetical protein
VADQADFHWLSFPLTYHQNGTYQELPVEKTTLPTLISLIFCPANENLIPKRQDFRRELDVGRGSFD